MSDVPANSRIETLRPVRRVIMAGRPYWRAEIKFQGLSKVKNFSVKTFGESGARLRAALNRMDWLIEFGIYEPDEHDPFRILNYEDIFQENERIEKDANRGERER